MFLVWRPIAIGGIIMRKSVLAVAVAMLVLMPSVSFAGLLEMISNSKEGRQHYYGLVGWYLADACHELTGQFSDDVAYFRPLGQRARQYYIKIGHHTVLKVSGDAKRDSLRREIKHKHPNFRVKLCKRELARVRARVK